MRTLAIVNQKGGSGKTTTALNLGAALARAGRRTLLVDLDPQGHCALGLAIPETQIELQIGDLMLAQDSRPFEHERLIWSVSRDLDLIPSTTRLAAVEAPRGGIAERHDRDLRLAMVLARFAEMYDWCLIDCPPSIGLLTFNALRAASEVLIPVQTGFFALQGAVKQVNTIRAVSRKFGVGIPYRVLATMHDRENPTSADILTQVERRFGERMIPVIVRFDPRLGEAVSGGVPLVEMDEQSPGAVDHCDLAAYLLSSPVPSAEAIEPDTAAAMPGAPVGSGVAPGRAGLPQRAPDGVGAGAGDGIASQIEPTLVVNGRVIPAPSRMPSSASRAADLAERAKRLSARTAELSQRLEADGELAAMLREEGLAPPHSLPMGQAAPGTLALGVLGVSVTPVGTLFRHHAPPGARVSVAGDFNGWSGSATPMRYNPVAGCHEALVTLAPGTHRYRLVVDGAWITDPCNPLSEANPFGARDSVVSVPVSARSSFPGASSAISA